MSLADSLDALVVEHDRIGSPLRDELRPGTPRADVEAAVRGTGLEPHPELVDFFTWHDLERRRDGRSIDWFWPVGAFRLVEAVSEYRRCIEIGGITAAEIGDTLPPDADRRTTTFTGFWRTDWFPLFGGASNYAIECPGGGGSTPGAIWFQNWHPDPGYETVRVAPDLKTLIDRAVELFRAGGYRWDPDYQDIVTVDEVFERLGLGHWNRPHTSWVP